MADMLNNHVLLTSDEVAALLQPHMHHKSALDWLANDRRKDPAILFVVLQGEPYYRESDVVDFISHVLNPSAHFIRVNNHLNTERRELRNRRRHGDRRGNESIELQPGIERRRQDLPDRRQCSNRRDQASHNFW